MSGKPEDSMESAKMIAADLGLDKPSPMEAAYRMTDNYYYDLRVREEATREKIINAGIPCSTKKDSRMSCLIVSFPDTTQAMLMQSIASKEGLPGRIIPVPRTLSAGCGMAWAVPAEKKEEILSKIREKQIRIEKAAIMEYELRQRHG